METVEYKGDCRLDNAGREARAFAHLIEVRYGGRFVFWNVVLQITSDEAEKLGDIDAGRPAVLRLEDGREGMVLLLYFSLDPTGVGPHSIAGVGKPK